MASDVVFQTEGTCPTCLQDVVFVARGPWLRDDYVCSNCGSIPRERALMDTLDRFFPDWPTLTIHESSPIARGASARLARECSSYLTSQFWPDRQRGSSWEGVQCEDLEKLTFPDESIDLHVTQDVFEHLFDPCAAFREIARTLRPGGAHVFTVPLVNGAAPSRRRAERRRDGTIRHLEEPQLHASTIDPAGSLVTIDWGYDITQLIFESCGLHTRLDHVDDVTKGIRGELNDVLITVKPRLRT